MKGDAPGGPIRWRLHLPVPPDRVFAALDSAEEREAFWAESAAEVAGAIEFRFAGGASWSARILVRRPPAVLEIDYAGGPARFELAPDGQGGTELLLTQEGVEVGEWNEVHAGWLNVLLPLKAWVVHGARLRNRDAARSWDRGFADG